MKRKAAKVVITAPEDTEKTARSNDDLDDDRPTDDIRKSTGTGPAVHVAELPTGVATGDIIARMETTKEPNAHHWAHPNCIKRPRLAGELPATVWAQTRD